MPTLLSLLAHPDDAEILCGGTMLALAELGWRIHTATMSPGDCGSATLPPDEIAAIRRQEGAEGAERLSGRPDSYDCLEERDLRIHYSEETTRKACSLFRRVRPDVVIAHSPSDYMLDHEESSRIARAACFNAPIPSAPALPDCSAEPLEHIPTLYYADPAEGLSPLGETIAPSILVDVSELIDRKCHALAAHASQRDWLRKQHGIDEYIDGTKAWSADRGRLAGVAFGEGFRQHLGHAYPREDLLSKELGSRVHRV